MSLELRDVRAKISVEADCAIEARAQARGMDKAEMLREIVELWATAEIHAATLLHRKLRGEGIAVADQGKTG